MQLEEPFVGFHPTPHKGHCPLTHPADGIDGAHELCAAVIETTSDKWEELQKTYNG